MTVRRFPFRLRLALVAMLAVAPLGGCDDGDGGLSNGDPGPNDVGVVVAFGDSITQGNMCSCVPYPARVAGLIGKTVVNSGVHGTMAREGVERIQGVLSDNRPGFMLILYGVNDGIHGDGVGGTVEALREMVAICRENHVVPVLGTYPIPIKGHAVFAHRTRALNAGIRELAQETGMRCVDLEKEFAGTPDPVTGLAEADPALMEDDGLHPNDAGTQIVAMSFADLF